MIIRLLHKEIYHSLEISNFILLVDIMSDFLQQFPGEFELSHINYHPITTNKTTNRVS